MLPSEIDNAFKAIPEASTDMSFQTLQANIASLGALQVEADKITGIARTIIGKPLVNKISAKLSTYQNLIQFAKDASTEQGGLTPDQAQELKESADQVQTALDTTKTSNNYLTIGLVAAGSLIVIGLLYYFVIRKKSA